MLATEIKSLKTDSAMKSSVVANVAVYCQLCGSPSHFVDSCPVMGQDDNSGNQEDANYVGQNNQGSGFASRSGMNRWDNPNRNNPNLSYKPQIQGPPGSYNNRDQSRRDQNSDSSSNIKAMLASFIADQRKTTEEHRKASEQISTEVRDLRRTVEQLAIQNRMLETQMAQQANSATREHGKLPSKLDLNPRASVNVITLRGGKQIEMVPAQAIRPLLKNQHLILWLLKRRHREKLKTEMKILRG
ncbi:unnamed protein product [Rhodiola kirilowii]